MTSLLLTSRQLLDRRKPTYSLLFALVIAVLPMPQGQQPQQLFKSHYEAARQL